MIRYRKSGTSKLGVQTIISYKHPEDPLHIATQKVIFVSNVKSIFTMTSISSAYGTPDQTVRWQLSTADQSFRVVLFFGIFRCTLCKSALKPVNDKVIQDLRMFCSVRFG